MLAPLIAAAALVTTSTSPSGDLRGTWDLRTDGGTVFRIEVQKDGKGWSGVWKRPTHFQTDFQTFSELKGPTVTEHSKEAPLSGDNLDLVFPDPTGGSPDTLRLHLVDRDRAQLSFVGAPIMKSFEMTRSTTSDPIGPWDPNRPYSLVANWTTSPEMTALFEADREDRKASNIDWSRVSPRDAQRMKETQALLDRGSLQSGTDFLHAAFIFQHGDKPEDYLKAHLLATIAVARGRPDALWIASATLDRYLQALGQPQVLGTQYRTNPGSATQEPYNRTLISDSLREALRVPSQAQQELQRQSFARPQEPTK